MLRHVHTTQDRNTLHTELLHIMGGPHTNPGRKPVTASAHASLARLWSRGTLRKPVHKQRAHSHSTAKTTCCQAHWPPPAARAVCRTDCCQSASAATEFASPRAVPARADHKPHTTDPLSATPPPAMCYLAKQKVGCTAPSLSTLSWQLCPRESTAASFVYTSLKQETAQGTSCSHTHRYIPHTHHMHHRTSAKHPAPPQQPGLDT
jgi:hypothetical protein